MYFKYLFLKPSPGTNDFAPGFNTCNPNGAAGAGSATTTAGSCFATTDACADAADDITADACGAADAADAGSALEIMVINLSKVSLSG